MAGEFDYTQWRQSYVDRIESFDDLDNVLAAAEEKSRFDGNAEIVM